MDDATLRTRLQDLREGQTGDPERGAAAFTADGRWRDNAGEPWHEGQAAIRDHLATLTGDHEWDPFEVVVEGAVALVRYRQRVPGPDGATDREGWARLGLGEDRLTSWDALWTERTS